jgi:glycosyltransferase involved in cell wall biosynthesis
MKNYKIGIDAHNIRAGGGITHLKEILQDFNQLEHDGSLILLWATKNTLDQIEDNPYIEKKTNFFINFNIITRIFWHRFLLSKELIKNKCDILFVPGSMFVTKFRPIVTLSQNMLPFEKTERERYGFSIMYFKLLSLFFLQKKSFKNANGVIFLTNYAKNYILEKTKIKIQNTQIIPHGISNSFFKDYRIIVKKFSKENPFKIVYISNIDVYKHQDIVSQAIIELHNENVWVSIDYWGPAYMPALNKLNKIIKKENNLNLINYKGKTNHNNLKNIISTYDLFLYASSCENMPNILLEGMALGLPIACSNLGPMPEILRDGGLYFNPLNINEIKNAIKKYYDSVDLRIEKSILSTKLAKNYSWNNCSINTFNFLIKIKDNYEK